MKRKGFSNLVFNQNPPIMKPAIFFSLVLVVLLIPVKSYSQIEKPITKGNYYIGGGFSLGDTPSRSVRDYDYNDDLYDNHEESNSNLFYFSVYPSLGYFVSDGLMLGISLDFNYSLSSGTSITTYISTGEEYENKSRSTNYGIGISPFIKYYFRNGLFVKLDLGFERDWRSYTYNNGSKNKSSGTNLQISPSFGYAIFITPKISLEPALSYGYTFDLYKYPGDENLNNKNKQQYHNIALGAGFHYFF